MITQNNETVIIPVTAVVTSILLEEGKEYLETHVDNVLKALVENCSVGDLFQALPYEEGGTIKATIKINGIEHSTIEVE